MKINADNFSRNRYMDMSFDVLMHIVFEPDGAVKPCDKDAARALITRLENHYHMSGFGNRDTGCINELEAYLAGTLVLSYGRDV